MRVGLSAEDLKNFKFLTNGNLQLLSGDIHNSSGHTLYNTTATANSAYSKSFDSLNINHIPDTTTLKDFIKNMPNSSIRFCWSWNSLSDSHPSTFGGFHIYMFIKYADTYNRIIDFGRNQYDMYIGIYNKDTDVVEWCGDGFSELYTKLSTLESKFNNLFSQSGNTLTINY